MNKQNHFRATINDFLLIGSEGDQVKLLQEYLIELNYLTGKPDGVFGRNTQRAVLNFQKDKLLLTDGIVGPNTWQVLQRAVEEELAAVNEPTIREGDRNVFVKRLQLRLIVLGYFSGEPNGEFTEDTTNAVIQFQKDQNLNADGVVGPNTWRAINRAFSGVEIILPTIIETMKLGDTGENVFLLQRSLNALGYLDSEEDGNFDAATQNAVELFQKNNNLAVTGIVDQQTWEVLEGQILFPNKDHNFILLKEGDTGENVIILQEKLKIMETFPGSITGSFGYDTTLAVKSFQELNGLDNTGLVDLETWTLLFKLTLEEYISDEVRARPTLRLGDTGDDVSYLQTVLTKLMFYSGPINGTFDNATNTAVRSFQTNNQITADGVVGQTTWDALNYLYSPLAICKSQSPTFVGVVIDAGHGGSDPGAVSNEIIEKEYTLKISQYMANRFRELGVPFAMTRTTDETLSREERINRMKQPFGDVANAIVISNHINAGGGEGAEVIYALRNTPDLANKILNEIGNAGQVKRSVYQRKLPEDPTKDYYYIMRDTKNLQTTLVEYGFLDNPNDVLRLQKYWDKYAEATVKAVTEYMGYTYTPPSAGKVVYVVRSGDSLWSIANRFDTTVDEIKRLNNLTSNLLTIGQQLIISSGNVTPPSGNIVYVVKSGDSLWSIANKFDTTVDEIKRLNNLTSNLLTIGQQLLVPGVSTIPPETSPTVHTVQSGDTLYSIARQFNTTVDNLIAWNNLTSNVLQIGQRLIVEPGSGIPYQLYIVVAGDSLWSIANKFGTTPDELMRINQLTSNVISVGQQLLVPRATSQIIIHTVVAGDSLWSIANKFGTTVNAIKQLNNLTSDVLSIGQQLQIPTA